MNLNNRRRTDEDRRVEDVVEIDSEQTAPAVLEKFMAADQSNGLPALWFL